MYRPGELKISPKGCPKYPKEWCRLEDGRRVKGIVAHHHPSDDETGEQVDGGAYLASKEFCYECPGEVVIGGPEQIRALIHDLQRALVTLGEEPHLVLPCAVPSCSGEAVMFGKDDRPVCAGHGDVVDTKRRLARIGELYRRLENPKEADDGE